MIYNEYDTLCKNIHKSLLEVQDMNEILEQINTMLDDISKKISHIDEATSPAPEQTTTSNNEMP